MVQAQKRVRVKSWRRFSGVALGLFLCCFLLVSCGKKPSDVDSPPGGQESFRVYPDPSTDPSGGAP